MNVIARLETVDPLSNARTLSLEQEGEKFWLYVYGVGGVRSCVAIPAPLASILKDNLPALDGAGLSQQKKTPGGNHTTGHCKTNT